MSPSGRDGSSRSWNAGWKAGYRFRQGEKKRAHKQAEADRDQYRRELKVVRRKRDLYADALREMGIVAEALERAKENQR